MDNLCHYFFKFAGNSQKISKKRCFNLSEISYLITELSPDDKYLLRYKDKIAII